MVYYTEQTLCASRCIILQLYLGYIGYDGGIYIGLFIQISIYSYNTLNTSIIYILAAQMRYNDNYIIVEQYKGSNTLIVQ